MKKMRFPKYLLCAIVLASVAFQCECKNRSMKQINHLSVTLTFAQETIYIEDRCTPFTLTIRSNDALAQELKYQCVDWLVKDNLGKVVSASGDPIEKGYEFSYGDNPLYYQPNPGSEGQHILEITVSDENGTLRKKQQVAISVKDHLPIDFQVGLKPEKATVFVHESVKLILNITSPEVSAAQLKYQIKEISTDKRGTFSATAQGTPIGVSHALSYGKNVLYYNNPAKELGVHDLKLVVVSSKGDIQTNLSPLNILDTDFQVKLKLEKPAIFFYEQAKLLLEITSKQPEASDLSYHIQEASNSIEKGKFYTTAEGTKIKSEHALSYGKNILYYDPHQELGAHELKLVVINSNGNTQTVVASLQVLDIDFQVKIKPQKPTIFSHEQAKLIVNITSKQEQAQQLAYHVQEINTLEKGKFFATAEGSKISTNHALNYGKNVLYYNPCKQLGTHELKLVVASGHGSIKTVTTSLEVLDTDFQVKIKPEKPTIFFHESAKMILEISSHQEGSDQLSYQIEELMASQKGHFSLTPQGEPIVEKQALKFGKNVLYYNSCKQLGTHELKLVISNSNGNTKTTLASLEILDIDFQVKIKPEKPTLFSQDPVKLMIEIISNQEGSDQLSYQVQELSASQKGHFSLTPQGEPIVEKQALKFGKNVGYYTPDQPGIHAIQLTVVNSHGTTKEATACVDVRDTDFILEMKPEKAIAFSHEPIKVMVNISAGWEEASKLAYQIKELSTSEKVGQFSATPNGIPLSPGQTLAYGKNVYYYTPHQSGNHTIQLVVANNKGIIKEVKALLTANQATFSAEVKLNKPAKSPDTTWEVGLHCGSNSGLKGEKWQLASWQIEESSVGKLQDAEGHELAKKDVWLQVGLNKFKLVFSEGIELKSVPQLNLAILQPDGKQKQLVLDLSASVLSQLERVLGLLEEQYQVASQKLMAKEPFAQDKLDRVIHQLKTLRSNLDIMAKSTSITQDLLENALVKADEILHNSSKKGLINSAIQTRFGRGINQIDQQGRTPLIEAIDKKDLEGLDLVLSHPDVDMKARHNFIHKNNTAAYPVLSYAIMKGGNDIKILEKLLKAGANINDRVLLSRDPMAKKPIDSKLNKSDSYSFAYLDKYRVFTPEWSPKHQVANQDFSGETALQVAAAAKLLEPIKLLLAHGADINGKNSYWQTPLHLAIYGAESDDSKVVEVVQYLIEKGASINAGDLNDNTPLHYAYCISYQEICTLLERKGADRYAKNWLYGKNKWGKQVDRVGVAPTEMGH